MSPEQLAAWQSALYRQLLDGELERSAWPPEIRDLLEAADPAAIATARDLAERWCKPDPEPEGARSPSEGS